MIYNYDPILGLNYYSCELEFYSLEYVPPKMTKEDIKRIIDQWKERQSKVGIQLVDSTKPTVVETYSPIYSNVPYEI